MRVTVSRSSPNSLLIALRFFPMKDNPTTKACFEGGVFRGLFDVPHFSRFRFGFAAFCCALILSSGAPVRWKPWIDQHSNTESTKFRFLENSNSPGILGYRTFSSFWRYLCVLHAGDLD